MQELETIIDGIILGSGIVVGIGARVNRRLIRPRTKSLLYNQVTLLAEHLVFHFYVPVCTAVMLKYLLNYLGNPDPQVMKAALPLGLSLASFLHGVKTDIIVPYLKNKTMQWDQWSSDTAGAAFTFVFLNHYFS